MAVSCATGLDTTVSNFTSAATCGKHTALRAQCRRLNDRILKPKIGPYRPKYEQAEAELLRLVHCGDKTAVWLHQDCDAWWVHPISCNSRWHPPCARRMIDELVEKYLPSAATFTNPAHVILTVPNCNAFGLALSLTVLSEGFRRLRRYKSWGATKGIYSIEIKWTKDKGYHPHIHALVDWKWTDLRKLSHDWIQITYKLYKFYGYKVFPKHHPHVRTLIGAKRSRGSAVSKPQLTAALNEVVKYACGVKRGEASSEFPKYPKEVQLEIAAHLARCRRIQTFGKLRAAKPPRARMCCPKCGVEFRYDDYLDHWWHTVIATSELPEYTEFRQRKNLYDGWEVDYPDARPPPT